jgi:protein SCO1/2
MAGDVMNECARPSLLVRLALILTVALAACRADPGPPPLEGATLGGAFTLTDQSGRRVTDRDFAGKYRLVYFGYASCPDVCPVDLQMIGAGLRQLEQRNPALAARVQPIFISVDPRRDTPEVLRTYVAQFHPRLVGLTGTPEEIARVARAYGVSYRIEEPVEGGDPNAYLVDHVRMAVLYDPDGKPVAIIPHDQGPQGVADELERWMR